MRKILGWLGDRWWFLSGMHDAYEDGDKSGYKSGYDDGYEDGYEQAAYELDPKWSSRADGVPNGPASNAAEEKAA